MSAEVILCWIADLSRTTRWCPGLICPSYDARSRLLNTYHKSRHKGAPAILNRLVFRNSGWYSPTLVFLDCTRRLEAFLSPLNLKKIITLFMWFEEKSHSLVLRTHLAWRMSSMVYIWIPDRFSIDRRDDTLSRTRKTLLTTFVRANYHIAMHSVVDICGYIQHCLSIFLKSCLVIISCELARYVCDTPLCTNMHRRQA